MNNVKLYPRGNIPILKGYSDEMPGIIRKTYGDNIQSEQQTRRDNPIQKPVRLERITELSTQLCHNTKIKFVEVLSCSY